METFRSIALKLTLPNGLTEAGGALEVGGHQRRQLLHHAQPPNRTLIGLLVVAHTRSATPFVPRASLYRCNGNRSSGCRRTPLCRENPRWIRPSPRTTGNLSCRAPALCHGPCPTSHSDGCAGCRHPSSR